MLIYLSLLAADPARMLPHMYWMQPQVPTLPNYQPTMPPPRVDPLIPPKGSHCPDVCGGDRADSFNATAS